MTTRHAPDDLGFLSQVQRLADEGLNQLEIAQRLGLTLGKLRYRLGKLGCELVSKTDVRVTLTGERVAAFVERSLETSAARAG